jgi:hypothetical protein
MYIFRMDKSSLYEEVTRERVDGIFLDQYSDQSSDLVGTVVNIQNLQNALRFLTGYRSVGLSKGSVLHGVGLYAFGLTCTMPN